MRRWKRRKQNVLVALGDLFPGGNNFRGAGDAGTLVLVGLELRLDRIELLLELSGAGSSGGEAGLLAERVSLELQLNLTANVALGLAEALGLGQDGSLHALVELLELLRRKTLALGRRQQRTRLFRRLELSEKLCPEGGRLLALSDICWRGLAPRRSHS